MTAMTPCPLFDDPEHDNYRCRWCWGLPAEDRTDDDVMVRLVKNGNNPDGAA